MVELALEVLSSRCCRVWAPCLNDTCVSQCQKFATHVVMNPDEWTPVRDSLGDLVVFCEDCAKECEHCAPDLVYASTEMLCDDAAVLRTMFE